ncbi:hypothetical protein FBU30_000722 [Linnemannia zychae]|nr:hypothetical protein FBU30_000722 [Linnemannia zychae]
MTQLLESTKNYLKTSTRLGRRMSNYKLEAAASQSSLNEKTTTSKHSNTIAATNPSKSSYKRLSGLFNIDNSGRNKTSFSEDRTMPSAIHQTKTSPDTQDTIVPSDDDNNTDHRRRNSKSSEATRRSRKSTKSHQSSHDSTLNNDGRRYSNSYKDRDHASVNMEHEVPRGRSPTMSMSNTISTAASYNIRPPTTNDPHLRQQYQSHVWRRNLLEESIMYSLKLGYAERRRSSSRHRSSRPSKSDSPRARKAREQALLAAATGRDSLKPVPESGRHAFDMETLHEEILDRSIVPQPTSAPLGSEHRAKSRNEQQATICKEKNSPYQMDYNASMTNITHSFASITFELPEHQVSRIITSSAIPDLFKIKTTMAGVQEQRPRSRRNSRTLSIGGISPSPRVLTHGTQIRPTTIAIATPHQYQPNTKHVAEKVVEEVEEEAESPVSPTTATWVQSVFASLDETLGPKQISGSSQLVPLLQVPSIQATAV